MNAQQTYPVGIVGEANYQDAIRRCTPGQDVQIVHEPTNPYDDLALAVVTGDRQIIGYISKECWLRGAIHDEGKGCDATIKNIGSAGAGLLGVVLDVSLNWDGVNDRVPNRQPAAALQASLADASTARSPRSTSKGFLARILGL